MDLSIIIPAYNEEARINRTLDAYLCAELSPETEIIVVVNGSIDQTAQVAGARPEVAEGRLRVVEIHEPVGKGGAILRGFVESRGNKIAYTDADGSTPPEALLGLVDRLQGSGLCLGSRWLPESVVGTPQPVSRRVASRLFNAVVRLLFGIHVTDTQCGAKVISRDVMEAVLPSLGCTQWAFDVDLLFQVRRAGFPLQEVAIEWNDTPGSKVKIVRSSIEMVMALSRLRLRYSPLKPLIDLWDSTLGRKLFDHRLKQMDAVHGRVTHEA